jgi:hypothetical protein
MGQGSEGEGARVKTLVKRPAVLFRYDSPDMEQAIGPYCTAVMGLTGKDVPTDTIGSATLVTVKGRGCILTAHHVLYGKRKRKLKGVLDFDRISIYSSRGELQGTYPREWFVDVPIGRPGVAGEPDLAALLIPDHLRSQFNTQAKAFYNLDIRDPSTLKRAILRDRAELVVAGVPWEARKETAMGLEVAFMLGHVLDGEFKGRRGFHFVKVKIGYEPPASPPKRFGGVSGGGLWAVPTIIASDGTLAISGKPVLAGVMFIATARSGGVTSLRGHAARDIYGRARREIARALARREVWPTGGSVTTKIGRKRKAWKGGRS